jgi:hypothetical protein
MMHLHSIALAERSALAERALGSHRIGDKHPDATLDAAFAGRRN